MCLAQSSLIFKLKDCRLMLTQENEIELVRNCQKFGQISENPRNRQYKVYLLTSVLEIAFLEYCLLITEHEFHETCHSVTFIVMVNSHQR